MSKTGIIELMEYCIKDKETRGIITCFKDLDVIASAQDVEVAALLT